ncbi:uncharacterized protein LOC123518256 isoform X2 [Portunus trituberculatus]|uniref:uncharacterized protein LOC123518256 isoform X2 n=1 Tax=Portunus trituberculatus TaxID=210409 RepID=UPI001E1D1DBB|nr:uncharacterized protein LOC123518256 isoform X2 [Portunus trituberculatus]
MPATYATVRVMVMLAAAATMGVAGEGEWLLKASPYARIRSTPPSRVLTSPAVYRDALQESPERGMKALSPRIRPRKAYPSEEEVLTQSSEEENAKQLSSSEEEALASLPPRSSSEEAPLPLPLPPDQKQPMESRSSILLQTPPVKETTTTTTPATTKAPRKKIVSITRHYQGDIYSLQGGRGCGCVEGGVVGPEEGCQCQCPAAAPTFRDDTSTCVSVLHECILADFVSTSGSEKIPYVYLPLKHQLVHPTAEVALRGLEHAGVPIMSPVCVVTGASVLTQRGWRNMANTSTFEPPFRLFRDVGRTFVQWVGEAEARRAAEGRLVLVTLICRDAAQPTTPVFRPCLSFRVAGSPGSAGAALSATVPAPGDEVWEALSWGDGVIIGLVVACLTIIYIVGMSVFIQFKRKKKRENIDREEEEGGYRGNRKGGRDRIKPHHALPKPSLLITADDNDDIEDLSLASRNRRANRERNRVTFTSAMVHSNGGMAGPMAGIEPADGLERVPRSPLAVVTLGEADNSGMSRNLPTGGMMTSPENHEAQARRKLYFNPAYFEPELLQTPPPAALEFLARIREMITVAKTKMKTKIYHPSLGDIPEEDSDCQSRIVSRTVSGTTLQTEDSQDSQEETANVSDATSIQSDSLERRQKESDSRNSTLKRLAQRVNSHGESFVSEIIKTLDLKPRLPPSDASYASHSVTRVSAAPKTAPPPVPVNARNLSPEVEDDFPELIKPSMLRNVLRDGKRLTDLNNTFENFRQEMVATFQKMKKVGEAISPKSTLNRNKKKSKSSPKGTLERLENDKDASASGSGEGKVQKWLQTLDAKNSYTRMTEQPNSIPDSQVPTPENPDQPPPLPQKNSKPPTPPRKHRTPAFRSLSLSEDRKTHDEFTSHDKPSEGKPPVTRSLSWQNEHSHYGSNPRRRRPEIPQAPNDNLSEHFCPEDDSLNDLVSEAESKVPKMIPSDSESVYSDTKSRTNDSLQRRTEEGEGQSKGQFGHLPREEAMTARNEIYNKWTGAKTMSRLSRNVNESYAKVVDRLDENEHDEHTYEEIHIPTGNKQKVKRKAPGTPNTSQISSERPTASRKHHSEGGQTKSQRNYVGTSNKEDRYHDNQYMHSKSKSMVSEVTIDKCDSPIYSGCRVTIPVVDNVESETFHRTAGFDQDTLEKRGKKVERSGSITLDSLERPKPKKNNNNNNEEHQGSLRSKRRMTLPGDMPRKGDKSLLDIYESRSSVRSTKATGKAMSEKTYPPMKFTNVPAPVQFGSFYLSNISNANDTNMNMINNNNNNNNNNSNTTPTPKKYRTFRDYQDLKFLRQSSETDGSSSGSTSSSPLPVTGTSICVNFHDSNSNSSSKEEDEIKPPLPPKQTRNHDFVSKASSVPLPPKSHAAPPPLPLKSSKKYDAVENEMSPPKLPEKSYRKSFQETSSSLSSSSGSIPELTEEEARAILHGLLAHPSHEGHRLSTLHEEEVGGPFLGEGNTADDSNSQGSVPFLDAFSSGSLETPPSTPTSASAASYYNTPQPQEQHISLDSGPCPEDTMEEPQSPGSEARVSGEFILSTIGRSPTLRRHSSLSKEQMNGFSTRHRGTADGECHEEGEPEGAEFSLALKAKSDLEKHFKDKSGGESIKRTWRKILEKVDEPQEGQEHLSEAQVQRVIVDMGPKIKQDDSGYHSTDSSESANSRNRSQNSSLSSTSVPMSTLSSNNKLSTKKTSSQSLTRSGLPRRSSSLNRMASYSTLDSFPVSSSFQRNSFRASLSRSFPGVLGNPGGASLYINNKFIQEDDDDDDSFPARIY